MALEGTLLDFSFADILQLISLQRKTGVLTLKNEENFVTVSFLEGCIVGASTLNQHPEDMIGLILTKRGEVSNVELEAALRRQEETLQRLGRILIDHHVVPVDTVRIALHQQILQIVYRVFRWSDGEYHFSQETDIDYDRDLMEPMAADSIIMEGARMTDEWPFIDQRIPDREAVYIKVDPARELEVVTATFDDFEELGFSFEEGAKKTSSDAVLGNQVSDAQMTVYQLVNGTSSVVEIILESTLVEFETCKALADLKDRGLIREASQEEIAREMRREVREEVAPSFKASSLPWMAVPLLALLGLSLVVMPRNPLNPGFTLRDTFWNGYVAKSVSWIGLDQVARGGETHFFLHGYYPDGLDELIAGVPGIPAKDPWGRPYRMVTRGGKMLVTGSDSKGQPVQTLIISRSLAWEESPAEGPPPTGPGVRLLD